MQKKDLTLTQIYQFRDIKIEGKENNILLVENVKKGHPSPFMFLLSVGENIDLEG